jgi:dipeptidyl aminopeptidase/acylaminoacyl peptidase
MYKNVNKIASVRVPILILHGDADDVVECWHSLTLYDKYCKVNGMNGKICYMSVSGRGHNDL